MIAMKLPEHRGSLVGAMVVDEGDQVLAITESGGVIRTRVSEEALQRRARDTMGVRLMALAEGDSVVGVARNPETDTDVEDAADDASATRVGGLQGSGDAPEAPGATDPAATGDAGDARTEQTQADGQDEEDA